MVKVKAALAKAGIEVIGGKVRVSDLPKAVEIIATQTSKKGFYSSCVGWPEEYLDALRFLKNEAQDVDRDELLSNVEWWTEKSPDEVIPADDWHISYHKYGDVFFYKHSGIEYVFADEEDIKELQRLSELD